MEDSTIFNALLSYEWYIGAYDVKILQPDLVAIDRCKEYLNNNGEETVEWLRSNGIVIYRALYHYHRELDIRIKESRDFGDEQAVTEARDKRTKVIKYKALLKDFDKFVI